MSTTAVQLVERSEIESVASIGLSERAKAAGAPVAASLEELQPGWPGGFYCPSHGQN